MPTSTMSQPDSTSAVIAVDRRRHVRVAGRQVSDQRGTVLGRGSASNTVARPSSLRSCCGARSSSSRPNHFAAVSTSLSPRPDRFTTMIAPAPSSAPSFERTGDGVRRLDGRDDALGAAQQRERVHRLGVGDRAVLGATDVLELRVLGADARDSPDPLRSNAIRWSGRPRPAAGRSTSPGTRPGDPPVKVAACRPVSTPSPAASKPTSRTAGSSMNGVEDADRVGAAADAGDDRVGQPARLVAGSARAPPGR